MPFVETEQLGNYVEPELAAAMYTPEQYKLEQEEAQKKDVDIKTILTTLKNMQSMVLINAWLTG
jgi:hypothetical protein